MPDWNGYSDKNNSGNNSNDEFTFGVCLFFFATEIEVKKTEKLYQ